MTITMNLNQVKYTTISMKLNSISVDTDMLLTNYHVDYYIEKCINCTNWWDYLV